MSQVKELLPRIDIVEDLFRGYVVSATPNDSASFKYCTDAEQYRFRLHAHKVWEKVESYYNTIAHLVKTHTIMTHESIAAFHDFKKVIKAEALTMQVPPGNEAVFFSLSRLLQVINRNVPHDKSKRFEQYVKLVEIINQFTLKYKQS